MLSTVAGGVAWPHVGGDDGVTFGRVDVEEFGEVGEVDGLAHALGHGAEAEMAAFGFCALNEADQGAETTIVNEADVLHVEHHVVMIAESAVDKGLQSLRFGGGEAS